MSTRKGVDTSSKKTAAFEVRGGKQEIHIRWLRQGVARPVARDKELYTRAWGVARVAALLLRERYRVTRVRVFGSLVHRGHFHPGSDIDLAVEGLPAVDYWEAVTAVLFLDDRIPVELVDRAVCRPEVWEAVEREGVDL